MFDRHKSRRLTFHRLSFFSLPDIREDVAENSNSTVSLIYVQACLLLVVIIFFIISHPFPYNYG